MDEILISVKVLPPSIYFMIERIVRDLDLQFIAALIPFAAVSLVQLSRYGRPIASSSTGDPWSVYRINLCKGG